ncbi:MAG: 50S ribosomal protein L2 [Candidatus Aenigmarchaeota archaeon]|nr:50S ribosomal protein L2 [Candidatus Aenigmarchaeota archaeon]
MGKRIISRARGKGGPPYKSPGHRFAGKPTYTFNKGEVVDLIHDPARDAPLAKLKTDRGEKLMIAPDGIKVGDSVNIMNTNIMENNVLALSQIPKGSTVFAIENYPGSGPQLCCSPGTTAIIISYDNNRVLVQMPSKEFKEFNPKCLAIVGKAAGWGRKDKRYLKAGQLHFAKHARNKLWPRSSATKMNPVDHPFGGKTKPGTPKSISRWAPPGAKVGSIASRRSGKAKR